MQQTLRSSCEKATLTQLSSWNKFEPRFCFFSCPYELTFGEKDCRNYIDQTRRSRLGQADAEAIDTYLKKMQSKNSSFFQ